jgi:hypothetical protein
MRRPAVVVTSYKGHKIDVGEPGGGGGKKLPTTPGGGGRGPSF